MSSHPPLERLRPGVAGPEERDHLRACSRCRVEARLVAGGNGGRLPGLGGFGADAGDSHLGPSGETVLEHGTRLGAYELDGLIGRGGVAVVYRARHVERGTHHAIKVLQTPAHEVKLRLLQEGRAQSRLTHPNVVRVETVVEHRGAPGLVMELVPGPSLDRVIDDVRLTIEQVDALAAELFDGVQAAHDHGLVHRDLKPANILLQVRDGSVRARVGDFGLAKILDGDAALRTKTRAVMGTPAYMAPEQTESARSVDARSDIFALGVILYELLAGERPFAGESVAQLFAAIQAGRRRPLREVVPAVPERMAEAIETALATRPDDRFATVAALREAWAPSDGRPWGTDDLTRVGALASVEPLPRPEPEPETLLSRALRVVVPRVAGVAAKAVLGVPRWFARERSQRLQQATTRDGVRLAWASTGSGPVVIYVLGWSTHLEKGMSSPLYDRDRLIDMMSRDHTFVRFDGRGCGLSERNVGPMSIETRVADLEAVIEAVGSERVSLAAYSSGVPPAILYASRHPERLERLVLMSGMLQSRPAWDPELAVEIQTMLPLIERHWDAPGGAYRSWLVSKVEPGASALEVGVYAEFLGVAMNGRDAAEFFRCASDDDVRDAAGRVRTPTLVLHNTADPFYPPERGGQAIAAAIPGARLRMIEADRHILTTSTSPRAFEQTWAAVRSFLGEG